MKNLKKSAAAFATALVLPCCVFGQTPAPGSLEIGQKVEAEYYSNSNRWIPAHIVGVENDGYFYKIKTAPYGDNKELTTTLHYKRVRSASAGPAAPADSGQNKSNSPPASEALAFGKYGCTGSEFRGGEALYIPRGSFTIARNGTYAYYGFEKPSQGKFSANAKGDLLFQGGYFNGGKAEKIDRPHKFFLVFPANPDHRWVCALVR